MDKIRSQIANIEIHNESLAYRGSDGFSFNLDQTHKTTSL